MKVLLLYQFLNHTSTVSSLSDCLRPEGVEIECLDLVNLNFVSGHHGHQDWLSNLYRLWMRYGKMRRFLSEKMEEKYILSQIRDYDVIDIHFYGLFYNRIIPAVKKARKPLIIMIWGSDFYRASQQELEKKNQGFDMADIIHVESESVKNDFLNIFPQYKDKIYVAQFGLNQLDWLKGAMKSPVVPTLIEKETINNKLVVTCGYNGSKGQQHLKIIEAIGKQSKDVKEKIHIVIPFTYGGDNAYKSELEEALDKAEVTYRILDKRLSDEQMVELRRISNIAVNIQITDSFSASVQEHFMAGSIQIIGEWLPYDVFYDQGLYAVKTTEDLLDKNICNVISNYELYHNRCIPNSEKIYEFSSWKNIKKKWIEMYRMVSKA